MELIVRPLTIDDYQAILRLWADAGLEHRPRGRDSRDSMAREMQYPGTCFLGLFDSQRMLGVVIASWDGRRGWINRLAVDPDHRGIGLAGRLIREGETFLRQRGAVVIAALIHDENAPSMAAFERAGYTCMPEMKYFAKRDSKDS